jgi:predicted SnoaL-like aldol condensation-catalyzing enzyme
MTNKEIVAQFLNLVVDGRIDEAYNKFVDMNGRHHNIYFLSDFATLRQAMKDNHVEFPNKRISIKRVIAEGDMVAAHSNVILSADKNISVVHWFRLKDNKIIEMWDVGQLIPLDSPNSAF